ncbi:MAG: hypothetical protein HN488_08950, partial [Saprospiraceae bacterium]|nr:hypothetical protein [Saprospiraceae bacterium]
MLNHCNKYFPHLKTFQSTGIIFRRIKYSETSLIVDIFT